MQHCRFESLANPNTQGWAVSGAVNFYDAPVKMKNCLIKDNRCEDALNIISTTFELDNVIFEPIAKGYRIEGASLDVVEELKTGPYSRFL